jgi:hypothetical protein
MAAEPTVPMHQTPPPAQVMAPARAPSNLVYSPPPAAPRQQQQHIPDLSPDIPDEVPLSELEELRFKTGELTGIKEELERILAEETLEKHLASSQLDQTRDVISGLLGILDQWGVRDVYLDDFQLMILRKAQQQNEARGLSPRQADELFEQDDDDDAMTAMSYVPPKYRQRPRNRNGKRRH